MRGRVREREGEKKDWRERGAWRKRVVQGERKEKQEVPAVRGPRGVTESEKRKGAVMRERRKARAKARETTRGGGVCGSRRM